MSEAPGKRKPGTRIAGWLAIAALVVADISAFGLAAALASALCYNSMSPTLWVGVLEGHIEGFVAGVVVSLIVFAACRLYRFAWRFVGLYALGSVALGSVLGYVTAISVDLFLVPDPTPEIAWMTISWLLSLYLVGGLRIALRVLSMARYFGLSRVIPLLTQGLFQRNGSGGRRVLVLGGGPDGARLVTALTEDSDVAYHIVGLLDDAPHRQGAYIRFAKILGPLSLLPEVLDTRAVDEVFIAMANLRSDSLTSSLAECRRRRIPVYTFPTLRNVLEGKTLLKTEEIRLEELLRRPPFRADLTRIGQHLADKRVLVTGAGGSIGSELCRQIASLNPTVLILLGHGENSIDRVHRELCTKHPGLASRIQMVIASVADEKRIREVIAKYQPQVVFHAAAHKHVPIMQENVSEAVCNNVLGTRHVGEACGRCGVETVVLISTDKAVYPSSVMGATKWVAEQVFRWLALRHPRTSFVTVRFGNVLGSRGSVVPLFQEQIARKGPVTVTHQEMTRYFMTIPEAVQLVLQAGAVGNSGGLYLLDMGRPMRIMDLAEDMIRLHGYTREDIPIIVTGIRDGEKLHERLVMEGEELTKAADGLWLVRRREGDLSPERVEALLEEMAHFSMDEDQLFDALVRVSPREGDRIMIERATERKQWVRPGLGAPRILAR